MIDMTMHGNETSSRKIQEISHLERPIPLQTNANLKLEPAVEPVHPAVAVHVQRGVELRSNPPLVVIAAEDGGGGGLMAVSWRAAVRQGIQEGTSHN